MAKKPARYLFSEPLLDENPKFTTRLLHMDPDWTSTSKFFETLINEHYQCIAGLNSCRRVLSFDMKVAHSVMADRMKEERGKSFHALPKTIARIERLAMYQLFGLPMSFCDSEYGWPEGTAKQLNERYPERIQYCQQALVLFANKHLCSQYFTVFEKLLTNAPAALEIVVADLHGKKWKGKEIKPRMSSAAKQLLKLYQMFIGDRMQRELKHQREVKKLEERGLTPDQIEEKHEKNDFVEAAEEAFKLNDRVTEER